MKKFIVGVVFIITVLFSNSAHAYMPIDVFYTGIIKERIDLCGYGCGIVGGTHFSSDLKFAGGPVANNSVGYAQQFKILRPTYFDYLLASAHITALQDSINQLSTNTMHFKLYTGTLNTFRGDPSSPYPDAGTAAIISPFHVTTHFETRFIPELNIFHQFEEDGIFVDVPIPFDITLVPGTYWIAQERYPENTGFRLSDDGGGEGKVDSISVKFSGQVVPEPATMLLFGTGMMGAFIRRRMKS